MTSQELADRCLAMLLEREVEGLSVGQKETEVVASWDGGRAEGWSMFAEMLQQRLPVVELRRCWRVIDGEICGPRWEIELRSDES